ncbi:hypothetical protein H5410_004038 [Solanum commersonii]|uniref:Uncharacterized protein n=1 Tax=Solanum commersonii TaxID=4109 RepID=A0A9J6B6M0_SOLCO|nr:hypothetical protein H5410_004038 [Solanum commersonii]
MEIINEKTKESRMEKVKIQYDMLPKYCKQCKVQGHEDETCRSLHPELRQTEVLNAKGTEQGTNDNNNEEQGNELATRRRRVVLRYWKPINKQESQDKEGEQEIGVQKMTEKGINIDNDFAALAEKKEEVHLEESTGTNDSNDKTSEVKSQREANKVHHHSSTKEWITNAFANYQGKGGGDTCSINSTTEQDNTEK